MVERANLVTFGGNPATLVGDSVIELNDSMPSVAVTAQNLKDVSLADYKGKVVILSTVASLDTSTCDTETRRFNKEAAALGDDIAFVFYPYV